MLRHYLKMALRNAMVRKTYSLINVVGLAVGMACCILILVHIVTELGYDRYHDNADRIYRIGAHVTLGGTLNTIASTNAAPAPAMVEEFPEVVNAARLRNMGKQPVRYEDRHFYEERILWADASIFEIFDFPLVLGNPRTALRAAGSTVVTEAMAQKYFGAADPIGKVLTIDNGAEFTVTGVLREVRSDSHFVFDMLCSMETLYERNREQMESWVGPLIDYSYILLHEEADVAELEAKLPAFVERNVGDSFAQFGASIALFLQPLTSIHLHSNLRHELTANSDVTYVTVYAFVAVAILLIACFNFMNLATARATVRSKEIGVRKVLGAERGELVRQFLAESMLYSIVSLVLGVALAHLALPFVGGVLAADNTARAEGAAAMSVRTVSIDYAAMPWLIPAFVALAVVIGLLAGSYPAVFLASFDPSRTLKGGWRGARGNTWFRRVLVGAQLAMSLVLIIATGVVLRQLDFLQSIRLGFDKSQVIVIPIADRELRASLGPFKDELVQLPTVVSAGAASHALGGRASGGAYVPEGYPDGETEMMDRISIDETWLDTLGMELSAGRGFSEAFPADAADSILINETAARKFGWPEAVGKTIRPASAETSKTVVGVVRDFYFSSPHSRIGPIYIEMRT